ncbi:MAG: hypothetical protein NAG76_08780 [Candidatus Pristimantibacillus lignocellulolyticus]|uniref:Uncharacterized protein n=1 Tax=Candidatus Pristimantibacillus lignocellulolyticus TaxID=2994561 RepID=A0A9J6ZJ75_9BACL|nr:MAG: hypothetical protein NAG76_08780 [Candidatus Pristimantibacillus lignocellulolyticus]
MNHKRYIVTSFIGSLILLLSFFLGIFTIVIMIFPFVWFYIYRMLDKVGRSDTQ